MDEDLHKRLNDIKAECETPDDLTQHDFHWLLFWATKVVELASTPH